jgi:hypothetical protein
MRKRWPVSEIPQKKQANRRAARPPVILVRVRMAPCLSLVGEGCNWFLGWIAGIYVRGVFLTPDLRFGITLSFTESFDVLKSLDIPCSKRSTAFGPSWYSCFIPLTLHAKAYC